MGNGSVRKVVRMGVAAAIVATGTVWEATGVEAASFTQPPTRLYMAPDGTTLVASLVGVPVGTLDFGPGAADLISGDTRDITVDVDPGPLGCDTTTDQPVGVVDYDLDDCPRLQLDVVHGRLKLESATLLYRDHVTDPDGPGGIAVGDDNLNDPVWQLPGGAIISQIGGGGDPTDPNDPAGHVLYHLSGLEAQINSALDGMSYRPDDGYRYVGSNGERLRMVLVSGDPVVANANHDVEIRVLDVNDAATLEGPSYRTAQPGVELLMPPAAPGLDWPYAGSDWTVADPDNDEVVDTDDDPLPDGAGDKMLLVGFLDCGVPTILDQTGFHLRGGTFQTTDQDIEQLLTDFYDLTNAPTEVQAAVDLLLDALDAIEPGLTDVTLATGDPTRYTDLFAGIADIDQVAYALSQVTFLSDASSDACTLYTVVSDLGNNGLPLQYVGDPPTGVEVPFLGVPPIDIVETDIEVGDLQQLEVNFDPAAQVVVEGTTATATIVIDPPTHPAFDLRWSTVAGTATSGVDFQAVTGATISVPENAASVQITADVLDDTDPESDETFRFELTLPNDPPGSPSGFVRPLGFEVVSTQSVQTVTVQDDDQERTASIADVSVLEGNSGTTDLVFTVSLDQPAKGTETLAATTSDGTATVVDGDYVALAAVPVAFAAGQTSAQVTVTVNGDTDVELDETLTLSLGSPSNVAIGDGTATGTITNDDGVIGVTVDDVTVTEGNAGTTNAVFTVSLDEPAVGGETLTVSTADGTATVADGDYQAATQGITFVQGATSATFTVLVDGDTDVEPDETFTVNLSSPSAGLVLVDDQGIGTITNDDAPSDPSVIDIADAFVTEGGAANQTTISMTNPTGVTCRVTVTSTDGTAVAPGDYAALSAVVVDLIGVASVPLPLTIVDDAEPESGETFALSVSLTGASDPGCQIGDGSADVFIAASDGGANTPPFVTIDQAAGQADPTAVSPILFDVEFTEPVSGFDAGDVSFTGSTTDAVLTPTVTGGPQSYTVSVAATGATATGTVVASIPAGAATDGSAPSFASTSTDNTVTLVVDAGDVTAPTVTVNQASGQPDPTSASPILFTVVFSEPVSGFASGDVTLGGTAGATAAVVTDSGDSATFQVAVSGMTQDGTVIASVGAGVAVDAATNANLASTSIDNTVTYDFDEGDVTAPSVTVNQAAGQADPTSASPILFTVVFSEPVTGFTPSDLLLAGTAGPTSAVITGSGTTYTVAVSGMSAPGTVIVSVPAGAAVDAALNPSAVSTSSDNIVTYEPDLAAPLAIDVPDDVVADNDPGQAGAVVDFPPATASGGTPPVTVTCDRASGAFFPIGTTTVTCTATDAAVPQQTVSDSFTVTVVDAEAPVIARPPDVVRGATSSSGVTVTFATPPATDNAGTPTVVCSPPPGALFRVGVTTVNCTATDAAGNSAGTSFRVTVTAPASGVPATGADTSTLLLAAALLVGVGAGTRRIGRRT